MQQQRRPVEEVVAAIEALDLEPIKFKLINREEGEGWSREYVDQMEIAYKQFLTLVVKYPGETIAPSKDVDKFWHGHILDTMKYAQDCQNVFGYFLHHFPYFGMRGEEDAANLAEAGRNTARLHEYEFNAVAHTTDTAMCGAAKPAMCGAALNAAMCGATVAAAMCGAAKPAMCGAAKPAMCGAALNAAMCGATVAATMCGAAVNDVAMCGAAKPAMCGATVTAAMCGAAKPAMCGATVTIGSGLNTSVRPRLELAA
jgi:hypothetical protein